MAKQRENPFDSIEDAHQYIGMLRDLVDETQTEVHDDMRNAQAAGAVRRVEALYVVVQKLGQLDHHLNGARRTLNDLRTLRRLMFAERESAAGDEMPAAPARPASNSVYP